MSTIRVVRPAVAVAAAFALLALAGCATPAAGGDTRPGTAAATAPAPPTVEVLGQGTVMDVDGDVEFCLGAVAESYPPQCSGIPIEGWSWDGIDGSESANGVTWGAYALVGTYDGKSFTPTQDPIMLALFDPAMIKDPSDGVDGKTDDARLEEIQGEITGSGNTDVLSTWVDRGYVWVQVTWDDGSYQKLWDGQYGPGVVLVQSALSAVGEKSQIDK